MLGFRSSVRDNGSSIPAVRASVPEPLVAAFLAHGKATPALLQDWLDASPENPRAHATKALMLTLRARAERRAPALASAAEAVRLAGSAGEADRLYVAAAESAARGDWPGAIEQLEGVLARDAGDSLAAKMSHAFRFMLGDKTGLLRSIERVVARLPADHPHRGFLEGCHAFALEENGRYAEAERVGRDAVARESRDAWGVHAVSHVHEMTGRFGDGIAWLEGAEGRFDDCNNFAGHLFWHLALFRIETGRTGEVLALYDRSIRRDRTDDFRDIANAASLLARLELEGVSVGHRWEELAEKAGNRLDDRSLVFADLHYVLALVGAGRIEAAETLARSLLSGPAGVSAQDRVGREVGGKVAEGLVRLARGDAQGAFDRLWEARSRLTRIGGSDAQRDVFEQITLEAALRAGADGAARRVLGERLAARGGQNRFATQRLQRLGGGDGRRRLGLLATIGALRLSPVSG